MLFFISFLAGIILFYSFQYFPVTNSIIFLLFFAGLIFKKRYLLIPVLAVGVLYGFFRYVPEADFSDIRGKEVIATGVFTSDAVPASTGKFIQEFRLKSAVDRETGEQARDIVGNDIFIFSDSEFATGRIYEIEAKTGKDNRRFNPGMTENNNIYANLIEVRDVRDGKKNAWTLFEDARAKLNRHITDNFNSDSAALISAITTGQRGSMSEALKDAFNSTGLAHVLSISGTHFGIFSVLLFGIFRLIIKFLPYGLLQRITLYASPSQTAAALSLPFMLAYLALSGWSLPAVRSFIMISLFLIGLLIGRKRFWLNSLLFAAFVMVLWNPEALFSLSFQLSFLAVLFIGFAVKIDRAAVGETHSPIHPFTDSLFQRILRYCAAVLKTSILLTLSASLGTAPLVAYHFHYFSVISPVSNLLITPLVGFVLLPLSLLSSFVFLFTGHFIFSSLVSAVTDVTIYLVRFTAEIPFSDIKIPAFPLSSVIVFYAGFGFYFFVSKKKLVPLITSSLLIIYLLVHFSKGSEMGITYLDVGQGDGAVIELPDKKVVVVDTGKSGREVSAFLKYLGRNKIDALVLSHADSDHAGGADYLKERFKIRERWDNGRLVYQEANKAGLVLRILERGDVLEGHGYKIYALHPYKEFYTINGKSDDGGNDSSLVLKIEGRNKSFLFTGDIKEEAEEDIIHLAKWLKSDVIKVPHHGGRTSAYRPLYDVVSPEIAVISVGRGNSLGHPHQDTLDMLHGVKIYRTDINGAVKITEKDNGLEVKTHNDFRFSKTRSLAGEMKNIKRLFEVW